jgi:uncharacterized protein involved in exopolysaccharide biosynthesis/Mrp family chromosome partitioning ATPase
MSTAVRTLPPSSQEPHPPSLGVHDILFVLFKYKRTILTCTAFGLVAAAGAFFFYPPVYQSQAKLLVRYVVERSAVDAVDTTSNSGGNRSNLTMPAIASEVEILTSWDLAVQVAEAIGAKRFLPNAKGPPSNVEAAAIIAKGLHVEAPKEGNVLLVSYESREPQLATLVLEELVNRYFVKHLEVHRSAGAFNFVTQQTDQVRARLNQAEDALKPLNEEAGIISLADGRTTLSADLARTEEQLHTAETEFAEQQARVKELGESPEAASAPPKVSATKPKSKSAPPAAAAGQSPVAGEDNATPSVTLNSAAPRGQIQQYQAVVSSLAKLRQTKLDLLSKYTPRSVQVQLTQTQIDDLESQRAGLEKKFPDLPATVPKTGMDMQQTNFVSERAQLAGLAAKVDALKTRLREVRARVKQLAELGPQIANLERNKELEEANYKYFQSTLEKSRIDEALDPSKIPNISAVQKPSAPRIVTGPRNKLALLLAGAGLALGLVIALVVDLVLNRTVKRPLELERQLHVPVLISIPYTPANGQLRLPATAGGKELALYRNGNGSNGAAIAPWSAGHFIRPYCEAIRDRFGLYFELNHLTHKPKLVGVTSFSHAAGTSTLAAGLASALSETDDGKVLLVDVNLGPGDVHPFFKGKPAYPLAMALQPSGAIDAAADNLYLATVGSAKSGPAQLGLKRFFDLMPNLRASDFDYIIFDMPPLSQTSPTWGMSAFMDKMLLMVEGEANDRDLVKRGYAKLQAERDNVSVVFNKARSFGPKWLSSES